MDVSPKTLREVEFREKMRGYHPEDVDQFLEQVAAGLEVLQDRLRQAVERAQRAEAAASADPGVSANDETLRRTLVLAQRTADMAVQEAREQAARIVAAAEQQAQALLLDSEDRARRTHEESLGAIRAELGHLETLRQRAQAEIDAMRRWIDDHRAHLTASLQDALSAVERAGAVSPPPASTPVELPSPIGAALPGAPTAGGAATAAAAASGSVPQAGGVSAEWAPAGAGDHGGQQPGGQQGSVAGPAGRGAVAADGRADPGPDTAAWMPADHDLADTGEVAAVPQMASAPQARSATIDGETAGRMEERGSDAEEQALDEFFEEGEYADDRRFGGRLRRRR